MMDKEYDVVIFGATGYTGCYVIEELAKVNNDMKKRWAVAGRNEEKLKASLAKVQKYLDNDINILNIPKIVADVSDRNSIASMCRKARLILNCVGPYKLYGEVVVEECIANNTHHVDISGEMKYLEETQAKHFHEAKEKGVYIVQACGFDCIPADFGIALLKDRFSGELNSVESYVQFSPGPDGQVTNIGTWMSAVHSVKDVLFSSKKLMNDLRVVFTKDMPKNTYSLKQRFPIFFSEEVKGWCLPFIGPDERVIKRSQMFGYNFMNERPAQAKAYMRMNSFLVVFGYLFFTVIFGLLSLFSFGRNLLVKHPSFFSAGLISHEGPTRKQVQGGKTTVTLCGVGWSEILAEPTDQHRDPPNKRIKLIVNGPEPAYALTSICMLHSGMVILDEADIMPLTGGVMTPGAAFAKTSLQKRLEKRGVTFTFEE